MKKINHGKRKHALLSASGASRWLACTPSARLEEEFPEEESSVYAKEGTLAHEFGDVGLQHEIKQITKKAYNKTLKELRAHELYSDEMEDEVQKYTDYVLMQYTEAKRKNKHAVLLVERKIDLTEFIEDGFGTGDATIISDGVLEIIDLKYGKGVQVDAEENPQLMLYGLGSLHEHMLLYDIDTVRMTIVQPRLNNISTWTIEADDLITWGEETIKPTAAKAYEGEGELVPGDHCKWCKVKPRCPALANANLELAQEEFAQDEIELLDDDEVISIYEKLSNLQDWAKSVADYVLKEALKGKKWPGYKLVEGRSNRRWVDDEGAIAKLKEEGYTEEQIVNTKIKGIGDIEKLVKRKNFPILLDAFVVKPEGAPTLAPESDKRPEFGAAQAQNDFGDDDEEDL